jgi:hypothetical protein
MKNQTANMPDFWSEVLAFFKTSLSPVEQKRTADQSTDEKQVYIFKSNVYGIADVLKVDPFLSKLVGKKGWSIDLDDEDKVLRVVCSLDDSKKIVKILREKGYSCTAMHY